MFKNLRGDYLHAAPLKMYPVGFRAFESSLYWHRRAIRTNQKLNKYFSMFKIFKKYLYIKWSREGMGSSASPGPL